MNLIQRKVKRKRINNREKNKKTFISLPFDTKCKGPPESPLHGEPFDPLIESTQIKSGRSEHLTSELSSSQTARIEFVGSNPIHRPLTNRIRRVDPHPVASSLPPK